MNKDLLEQINDAIAPMTRAWKSCELVTITIDREGFCVDTDDELAVVVKLILRKEE